MFEYAESMLIQRFANSHRAAGLVGMLGMATLGVVVLRLHHVQWMAVIGLVSLAVSVATASVHGIVNKSRICLVFLGIPLIIFASLSGYLQILCSRLIYGDYVGCLVACVVSCLITLVMVWRALPKSHRHRAERGLNNPLVPSADWRCKADARSAPASVSMRGVNRLLMEATTDGPPPTISSSSVQLRRRLRRWAHMPHLVPWRFVVLLSGIAALPSLLILATDEQASQEFMTSLLLFQISFFLGISIIRAMQTWMARQAAFVWESVLPISRDSVWQDVFAEMWQDSRRVLVASVCVTTLLLIPQRLSLVEMGAWIVATAVELTGATAFVTATSLGILSGRSSWKTGLIIFLAFAVFMVLHFGALAIAMRSSRESAMGGMGPPLAFMLNGIALGILGLLVHRVVRRRWEHLEIGMLA